MDLLLHVDVVIVVILIEVDLTHRVYVWAYVYCVCIEVDLARGQYADEHGGYAAYNVHTTKGATKTLHVGSMVTSRPLITIACSCALPCLREMYTSFAKPSLSSGSCTTVLLSAKVS